MGSEMCIRDSSYSIEKKSLYEQAIGTGVGIVAHGCRTFVSLELFVI